MPVVDLNADLGESFGNYSLGHDPVLIPLLNSAHLACGFHASDPRVMDETVRLCREAGVQIGAHPGFPDLVGFGRRVIDVSGSAGTPASTSSVSPVPSSAATRRRDLLR